VPIASTLTEKVRGKKRLSERLRFDLNIGSEAFEHCAGSFNDGY
jgi:hypothetical protein